MPVNVTDMLHTTALDGKLAETTEIFDPTQKKFQKEINAGLVKIIELKYDNGFDVGLEELRTILLNHDPSKELIIVREGDYFFVPDVIISKTESGELDTSYLYWLYTDGLWGGLIAPVRVTITAQKIAYDFLNMDLYPLSELGQSSTKAISQKAATDAILARQLKPAVEGTVGQVLTKTGPKAEDVKWVTPSSSASPYERISQADVVSVFQLDDDPDVPSGGGSLTLTGEIADNTRIMIVGHVKIKNSAGVTTCYALSAAYPASPDSEVHIFDHGDTYVSATISGTEMTIYLETLNRDDCPEVTVTISGIYKLTI